MAIDQLQESPQQTTVPTQRLESTLQGQTQPYRQYRYRFIIVLLVVYSMLINGLSNNNVIPIASKISSVYNLSTVYTTSPITTSFLVYSLMNFPANHIIDTKGLRVSFMVGSGLYALGMLMTVFVNTSYVFVLIGAVVIALGQPFIINCPAKVATFWFTSPNRPIATAVMTAANLVGTAAGFVIPTLFVNEDSVGQKAKEQIFKLYGMEAILGAIGFILVIIFFKAKPATVPSMGASQQKTDLKQSLQIIKYDRNLWFFIGAYVLVYGTLLAFGSMANLLFKPYGFKDFQIALMALCLLFFGVLGSIAFSVYIKRTTNYRLCIRMIPILAIIFMSITCIFLNIAPLIPIMFICTACIGFSFTPLVPICYDLGCQLAFPMGQAQVIGILNGGSMIYTFLFTLILTSALDIKTKTASLILMIIFTIILAFGAVLFWFVKVELKRRMLENGDVSVGEVREKDKQIEIMEVKTLPNHSPQRIFEDSEGSEKSQRKGLLKKENYDQFVEDAL